MGRRGRTSVTTPVQPPNSLTSDRVVESESPEKVFGKLPVKGKKGKKK